MKEQNFFHLVLMLRFLEKKDLKKIGIEDCVADLIDNYQDVFSEEQKKVIKQDFSKYEQLRAKKNIEKKMKIQAQLEKLDSSNTQFLGE